MDGECRIYLQQLYFACCMYADDNDGCFPDTLEQLKPKYLEGPHAFTCVGASMQRLPQPHYEICPGLRAGMPVTLFLVYDKSPRNHEGRRRNVCLLGGERIIWPGDRDAEFVEKRAAQKEAVTKWRAAGAKTKDIDRFFGKPAGGEKR